MVLTNYAKELGISFQGNLPNPIKQLINEIFFYRQILVLSINIRFKLMIFLSLLCLSLQITLVT